MRESVFVRVRVMPQKKCLPHSTLGPRQANLTTNTNFGSGRKLSDSRSERLIARFFRLAVRSLSAPTLDSNHARTVRGEIVAAHCRAIGNRLERSPF